MVTEERNKQTKTSSPKFMHWSFKFNLYSMKLLAFLKK